MDGIAGRIDDVDHATILVWRFPTIDRGMMTDITFQNTAPITGCG